ncbi:dolichyl-diphosphooligosaccharide--protein glycosyltransferase subunit 1-like [Anopheles albimanus]|uniref:Dolichyl-diphosphooligosaccharide--protein glycosyltransferase subunit 1 n=1 Tax=Anopheles albimanus TaxID=7167 RepID=A0A8W7K7U6_ANOAL|nr:dolichyl-diphosphooligosaccharide--protein glycosyltransferase subunit 1-like [Anopheles albimanus]XP_035794879.1 dolichyl-diphosphooligosaccharide--protein glycosyltransferase subunit 1-like [Anopheles albimanus]
MSYPMRMVKLVLVFAGLAAVFVHAAIDMEVENKAVDRTIDLTSQLVKISYKITLEHISKLPISSYLFVVPQGDRERLAYISVKDSSKKELKLSETVTPKGVTFSMALPASSVTPVVYIETVFTKSLKPFPSAIGQNERQLVQYFGNVYFYSPYKTVSQKTTVHLSSRNVENYTQFKPSSHADSTIVYGPYDSVTAFSQEPLAIHFENFSPFLTISRLYRTIEVSHWGNIAVEETVDILHSGATLKGAFSRYDYQKDTRSNQPSVKSYKTLLPASASGVYYRDTNGNISTSSLRTLKDAVELELRPRFPLFGGWRTHYTLGYNVPTFEYLFQNNDNFLLKMRVIDHIFDDMAIDEVLIKIILPEGSSNIKLITPYSVTRHPDSLHYTYLDTFGRPVIMFSKQNLVENHINDFNLKYNFSWMMMLQEPLLVVAFLYILFVFVIFWMRMDFSIIKEKENHLHKD